MRLLVIVFPTDEGGFGNLPSKKGWSRFDAREVGLASVDGTCLVLAKAMYDTNRICMYICDIAMLPVCKRGIHEIEAVSHVGHYSSHRT
jgi:hypothetical protein